MITTLLDSSFNNLHFEPVQHRYTLEGRELTSVSKVVETYEDLFDVESKSIEYAKRYNLNLEEVRESWKNTRDIACDFGHSVHNFGERYFYNKTQRPTNNHEFALVKFWKELPDWLRPIACEKRIYITEYGYAGTFDLLLHDVEHQGVIIVDYKTNKDLFKNFKGKKLFSPFDFLFDNPYNHYQLQLSLYQIPLENIGIKVLERWVIWLTSDGEYLKYKTEDYTAHLKQDLKLKQCILVSN